MPALLVFGFLFLIRNALELHRAIRFKMGVSDYHRSTLALLFLIYIAGNSLLFYELLLFKIQAEPLFWAGAALYTMAFVIREIHSWMMNQAYHNTMAPKGKQVIKKGLFSLIRHPLYFLYSLELVSFFIISLNLLQLALLVCFIILLIARIKKEEHYLLEKFGAEYSDYQRNTKKLIPFLF